MEACPAQRPVRPCGVSQGFSFGLSLRGCTQEAPLSRGGSDHPRSEKGWLSLEPPVLSWRPASCSLKLRQKQMESGTLCTVLLNCSKAEGTEGPEVTALACMVRKCGSSVVGNVIKQSSPTFAHLTEPRGGCRQPLRPGPPGPASPDSSSPTPVPPRPSAPPLTGPSRSTRCAPR